MTLRNSLVGKGDNVASATTTMQATRPHLHLFYPTSGADMKLRALIGMTCLAGIWGSNFVLVEAALRQFSPAHIVTARILLAAITLLPLAHLMQQPLTLPRRLWLPILGVGITSQLLPWALYAWGQQHVSGSLAGVYTGATPLLAIPIAYLMLRTKPTRTDIAGAIIGFLGVCIVLGLSTQDTAGKVWFHLACIIGAASYGVSFSLIAKIVRRTQASKVTLALWQTFFSSLLVVPIALWAGPLPTPTTWHIAPVAGLVLLGIGSAVANAVNFWVVQTVGPLWASTSFYLIPLVAVLIGVTVSGDQMSLLTWLGCATVIAGMALVFRGEVQKHSTATTE